MSVPFAMFPLPVFDKLYLMVEDLLSKLNGGDLLSKLGYGDKKAKKWKRRLRTIQAVLVEAEQQQSSNDAVKEWLEALQNVAYDMEDVLDYLAIQAHEDDQQDFGTNYYDLLEAESGKGQKRGQIRHKNLTQKRFKEGNLSTRSSPIDRGIQEKIADITRRLKDIQNDATTLQLPGDIQQQTLQTEALRSQRETTSMVSKSNVFGRDDMKQEIITRLLRDNHDDQSDENHYMIPIVGAGGIGKTTLAQLVYNDEQLKDHFDLKAWVCVSDVFDVKRITTSIIKQFDTNATAVEFSNLNQAHNRLKQLLMGNKFLIVLDDIWNENYQNWDSLQLPFQHAAKGSRVIMTTRNEVIAKLMNTNSEHDNIIYLKSLSDDACWKIVQHHANNKTGLTEMRADIINKCKGLPLAAKVVGGILKAKDTRTCRQILKSHIWSKNASDILPVLWLSYYHLPSHLKRIFAYCSIFPKDFVFSEEEFVLLCMAQGFLPENQSESITMGQRYLSNLVSRSLLEVVEEDEEDEVVIRSSQEKKFIMHDLIHYLALQVAGDICHVMNSEDEMEVKNSRARHVFLTKKFDATFFPMASQLRTLYCCNNYATVKFSEGLSCIRALSLVSDKAIVLPECIGYLKHLRFLKLECPDIKKLGKSISKLWNLQTLLVERCYSLKNVPNVGSLKKLRHLKISFDIPQGIGNLTNLQCLSEFKLGDGHGSRVKELKNLNYLQGKLDILGLEKVSNAKDANEAQLHKKCGLDELVLHWGTFGEEVDDDNTQDVLEQLQPPTSIKVCKLFGYMGSKLPVWLGDPSFTNMVSIKLKKLKKCEGLPPLGQLPKLERLEIDSMESVKQVGAEFYGDRWWSNAFPALKHLKFSEMPSWEKWVHPAVEKGRAFPKLEGLEIMGGCRLLKGELPPHLPHLRTLKISKCTDMSISLASLPSVVDLVVSDCEKIIMTSGDSCELAYLSKLEISGCPNLVFCSPGRMHLPVLNDIEIFNSENLESLPSQMHNFNSLQRLKIYYCPKLQCIPEGGLPINLKELVISGAKIHGAVQKSWGLLQKLRLSYVESEEDISLPSSLCEIDIRDIPNLKNLRVGNCTNLTPLEVSDCSDPETLLGNFPSLQRLEIDDCRNLKNLNVGNCTNLTKLSLRNCPKLQSLPQGTLNSLEVLSLWNLGSSTDAVERIPGPHLDLPSSLCYLSINGFRNLKSISCSALPNLEYLHIMRCPKFEFFWDNAHALPPQLRVVFFQCKLVKQHLRRDPDGRIDVDGHQYSLP